MTLLLISCSTALAKHVCPKRSGAVAWIYVSVVANLGKAECKPSTLRWPNVRYEAPLHADQQPAVGDGACFTVPTPTPPTPMRIYCAAFGFQRNVKNMTTAELNGLVYQSPDSPFECALFPKPVRLVTDDCKPRALADFAENERPQFIRSFLGEAQAAGTSLKAACDELELQSRPGLVAREVLRAYLADSCNSKCVGTPEYQGMPSELRGWIDKRALAIRDEEFRDAITEQLKQSQKREARVAVEILNSDHSPPLPKSSTDSAWKRYLSDVVNNASYSMGYKQADLRDAVHEIRTSADTRVTP